MNAAAQPVATPLLSVTPGSIDQVDWAAQLNGWLQQSAQRRGFF